jgi:hypothetical protein
MGTIEIKEKYKTRSILAVFRWYAKTQKFDNHKCDEILSMTQDLHEDSIDMELFQSSFKLPFELLEKEGRVSIDELRIALLLISKDEQGSRIDLFKQLTPDPEKLFNYFRFKYYLIYSRIPEYLIKKKLLDPEEAKKFINRKASKILTVSNAKYVKYTTSSCNVLKLTLLRT